MSTTKYPQVMDYHQLLEIMPYRSPWMLIDRLLSWGDKFISVMKVVSGADPMVASHFPKGPSVIPGVLYIELVSQAVLLLGKLAEQEQGATTVLARCKADFVSPGFIGDTLIADVKIHDVISGTAVYDGIVRSGNRVVCKVNAYAATFNGSMLSSGY
jgi:3-hydroxymyristoyl/3-hydroxydecanoyl-(acyl carrier protein) dehydratase